MSSYVDPGMDYFRISLSAAAMHRNVIANISPFSRNQGMTFIVPAPSDTAG